MRMLQAFRMAIQTLFAKRARSLLTMLGTVIGVAAVIAIVSVTELQNEMNRDVWLQMSENMVNVYAYAWNMDASDLEKQMSDYINYDIADLTVGVTPSANAWGLQGAWGQTSLQLNNVYYGSEQFSLCSKYELAEGRDLCYMDIVSTTNVCVIGSTLKDMLFGYNEAVGERIKIANTMFEVIGVYEARNPDEQYEEWYEPQYSSDFMLVIPYGHIKTLQPNSWNNNITDYVVKCKDTESTKMVTKLLQNFLSSIIDQDSGHFYVNSNSEYAQEQLDAENAQMQTLAMIAAISLLVGGIGIMNIMLVTVTERTREIGIRKAIGAPKRSIISQFLVEACVLSGVGGLIGVVFGFALTLYSSQIQFRTIASPNLGITALALGVSFLMGVVFGLYPAVKAANLQPVDALRNE